MSKEMFSKGKLDKLTDKLISAEGDIWRHLECMEAALSLELDNSLVLTAWTLEHFISLLIGFDLIHYLRDVRPKGINEFKKIISDYSEIYCQKYLCLGETIKKTCATEVIEPIQWLVIGETNDNLSVPAPGGGRRDIINKLMWEKIMFHRFLPKHTFEQAKYGLDAGETLSLSGTAALLTDALGRQVDEKGVFELCFQNDAFQAYLTRDDYFSSSPMESNRTTKQLDHEIKKHYANKSFDCGFTDLIRIIKQKSDNHVDEQQTVEHLKGCRAISIPEGLHLFCIDVPLNEFIQRGNRTLNFHRRKRPSEIPRSEFRFRLEELNDYVKACKDKIKRRNAAKKNGSKGAVNNRIAAQGQWKKIKPQVLAIAKEKPGLSGNAVATLAVKRCIIEAGQQSNTGKKIREDSDFKPYIKHKQMV